MKKIQQISIKGILRRDDKILFLKTPDTETKSGVWELPGGRMDFGETVEQAFEREMKEEIGFEKVKLGEFINIWSFASIRNEINYHFVILDFEIFTNESKIELSFEHMEYKWIGKDEFEDMNMREGHKESLRKYFNKL